MKKKSFGKIINECIGEEIKRIETLNEIKEIDRGYVDDYLLLNYPLSINEMSRINTKEFNGYFPFNKFEIKIWSNDHNPPHFHVIVEDWDIVVDIMSGDIIRVKHVGKDSKAYSYVEGNIKKWLNEKSALRTMMTNRENALFTWEENNP